MLEDLLRKGLSINHEPRSIVCDLITGKWAPQCDLLQNGLRIWPMLVVDTSSIHSQLRATLLPSYSPVVLPFAVFNGKRYIEPNLFANAFALAFGDGNTITYDQKSATNPQLEVTGNEHSPNGSISISYVYSLRCKNGTTKGPLHNPDRLVAGANDVPEDFYGEVEALVNDRSTFRTAV